MNISTFYGYRLFSVWRDIANNICCLYYQLLQLLVWKCDISLYHLFHRIKKNLKRNICLTTNWELKIYNDCFRLGLDCSSVIYILLKSSKIYRNPFYWKKKRKQLIVFLQTLVAGLWGSLKSTYFLSHWWWANSSWGFNNIPSISTGRATNSKQVPTKLN